MSLFDYYEPEPAQSCPVCGSRLVEWQGKDAECAMLVWRQGCHHPVGQKVDSDIAIADLESLNNSLPSRFLIYSFDCKCPFPVTAECTTEHEVWNNCQVITADNVKQWPEERRREYKKRLAWLRGSS